jgi:hypothetical protein
MTSLNHGVRECQVMRIFISSPWMKGSPALINHGHGTVSARSKRASFTFHIKGKTLCRAESATCLSALTLTIGKRAKTYDGSQSTRRRARVAQYNLFAFPQGNRPVIFQFLHTSGNTASRSARLKAWWQTALRSRAESCGFEPSVTCFSVSLDSFDLGFARRDFGCVI